MRRFSRRDVHIGVIVVLTVVALVVAVLHPGTVIHVTDLHDDGARATNGRMAMVAHLSYRPQTFNRGLHTSSMSFGVDQSGSRVVMSDASSDIHTQVDDIIPPRVIGSGPTVPILVSRRFCP